VADTADLLHVVKTFRKLIHSRPRRRLAHPHDSRTAYGAIAGMERVVIDIR